MAEGVGLPGSERHPVIGILGEELVPLVETLLVEEPRLLDDEPRKLRFVHGAMNLRQARNWLRIEISLVPLHVRSASTSSSALKFRCRLTHSLPSAARPSCAER